MLPLSFAIIENQLSCTMNHRVLIASLFVICWVHLGQGSASFRPYRPGYRGTSCRIPSPPANGSVRSKKRGAKSVSVGQKIWFECDNGFQLGGSRRKDTTCLPRGFQHASPTCVAKPETRCRVPLPPPNGSIRSKKRGAKFVDVGQKIWFHCNNGFKLGGSKRKDIKCLAKGFEHAFPTCLEIPRRCRIPRPPPNGSVRSKKRGAKFVEVGQKIWFHCDNGFQLSASHHKDVKCLASGWERPFPTCEEARGTCSRRCGLPSSYLKGCHCSFRCSFIKYGCCLDYNHQCRHY